MLLVVAVQSTYVLALKRVILFRWKGALPRVTIQMPVYKVSPTFRNYLDNENLCRVSYDVIPHLQDEHEHMWH